MLLPYDSGALQDLITRNMEPMPCVLVCGVMGLSVQPTGRHGMRPVGAVDTLG
jgi:hypothetical protein